MQWTYSLACLLEVLVERFRLGNRLIEHDLSETVDLYSVSLTAYDARGSLLPTAGLSPLACNRRR